MPPLNVKVYEVIVRRFLSIFYPPALYSKVALTSIMPIKEEEEKKYTETFNANFKVLSDKGYLKVMEYSFIKDKGDEKNDSNADMAIIEKLKKLKKNDNLECLKMSIKEGKTSPPKRYNSGALILAMENAGQLIEDEELREQIKGSGIGTSATRAEIIKKLVTIKYLNLNKKTQIITPTQLGEMIYEVVDCSIKYLLNPELTASWEKGLTYVAEGSISSEEYMEKLEGYVTRRTNAVKAANNQYQMRQRFEEVSKYY
jgi:DNA topoisomerase-3